MANRVCDVFFFSFTTDKVFVCFDSLFLRLFRTMLCCFNPNLGPTLRWSLKVLVVHVDACVQNGDLDRPRTLRVSTYSFIVLRAPLDLVIP